MRKLIRVTDGLNLLFSIFPITSDQKALAEPFVEDTRFVPHYDSGTKYPGQKWFIEKSKTHVRMREKIDGWRMSQLLAKH